MQLGGLLIAAQWLLWAVMLAALAFYQLDRRQHQSNLATIAARTASDR
jgi:hypothetical protein